MRTSTGNEAFSASRIVFVHGAGGGGWEWDIWTRVFAARGLQSVAPDLVPSESGLAATTFDDYLRQVLAWCQSSQAHAPERTVLIGASLGGLLALSVAAQIDAAALLLINPMPPDGIGDRQASAYPPIIPWGSKRSIGGTRRAMPDADGASRLIAWRRWRDESGLALTEASRGVELEMPTCPILVMASDGDDQIPAATSRILAARCAADFINLPNSSHVGPLLGTRAARVAGLAADWLAGLNSVEGWFAANP